MCCQPICWRWIEIWTEEIIYLYHLSGKRCSLTDIFSVVWIPHVGFQSPSLYWCAGRNLNGQIKLLCEMNVVLDKVLHVNQFSQLRPALVTSGMEAIREHRSRLQQLLCQPISCCLKTRRSTSQSALSRSVQSAQSYGGKCFPLGGDSLQHQKNKCLWSFSLLVLQSLAPADALQTQI